jgi:hypothetical protein
MTAARSVSARVPASLVTTGLNVGVRGLRYHGYADSELQSLGRLGFIPCRFAPQPSEQIDFALRAYISVVSGV